MADQLESHFKKASDVVFDNLKSIAASYSSGMGKSAQEHGGRYSNLLHYLTETRGANVDASTIDKRLRTYFEDMIEDALKNPSSWDKAHNVSGNIMMDYLASGKLGNEQGEKIQSSAE